MIGAWIRAIVLLPGMVLVIIPSILLLPGCSRENERQSRQETTTVADTTAAKTPPAKKARPARVIPLEPSKLGKSIGITAENYPHIDGSTSTLPLVQAIYISMFQPRDEWEFDGLPRKASKTAASYERLIAGDVDLIIVPDPSEDIKQQAAAAGVELEYIPIGREALVFITAKYNPVDAITTEQILKIYTDRSIMNWADLGGKDGLIIPLSRNKDSGSHAQMENLILRGKTIHPSIGEGTRYVILGMGTMLTEVEGYDRRKNDVSMNTYTLGYTVFYYLQNFLPTRKHEAAPPGRSVEDELRERILVQRVWTPETIRPRLDVKPLAVDGVLPTAETILSGEYKLSMGCYAAIRKDEPADSPARRVVDWLLTDKGQWTVTISGLGALRPVEPEWAASGK